MQALLAISLLLSSVASISNLAHLQDVRAHDKAAPTQVPATQTYVVPGAPWAPSNKEMAAQDAALHGASN